MNLGVDGVGAGVDEKLRFLPSSDPTKIASRSLSALVEWLPEKKRNRVRPAGEARVGRLATGGVEAGHRHRPSSGRATRWIGSRNWGSKE